MTRTIKLIYVTIVATAAIGTSLNAAADSQCCSSGYNSGNQMSITQIGVINTAVGAQSIGGDAKIAARKFVDLRNLESITMIMSSLYGDVDVSDARVWSPSH